MFLKGVNYSFIVFVLSSKLCISTKVIQIVPDIFYYCGKIHDHSNLQKEVFFFLWFQKDRCSIPSWWGPVAAGRHGNWSSNMRAHILNHKQKADTANSVVQVFEESKPAPMAHYPQ